MYSMSQKGGKKGEESKTKTKLSQGVFLFF